LCKIIGEGTMKKFTVLSLVFIFLFTGVAYSAEDKEITLTTYYPAPYGDYDTISLTPKTTANAPSLVHEGLVYFNSDDNELKVYIEDPDNPGSYIWSSSARSSNVWSKVGTDINYSAGNVGIATASPLTKLDIVGGLTLRAVSAPASAPADQARIYYDSSQKDIMVSTNAGAYKTLSSIGTGASIASGSFSTLAGSRDFGYAIHVIDTGLPVVAHALVVKTGDASNNHAESPCTRILFELNKDAAGNADNGKIRVRTKQNGHNDRSGINCHWIAFAG